TDRNGQSSQVRMSTPGLTGSAQAGDAAKDAALGVVSFKLATGDEVRGVIVADTIGSAPNDAVTIQNSDRQDAFVDVVVRQRFAWTASNGEQQQRDFMFRIKVANDDAPK